MIIYLPPLAGWQMAAAGVEVGAIAQIMLEVIGRLVTDPWQTELVMPLKTAALMGGPLVPCKDKKILKCILFQPIYSFVRLG